MPHSSFRRDWITKPIFPIAQHRLPRLSDTEREAIESGDVWWEADLFTGNPDWKNFWPLRPPNCRKKKRSSLPVRLKSSGALDDWKINWEWHDLPR